VGLALKILLAFLIPLLISVAFPDKRGQAEKQKDFDDSKLVVTV
jgi:hypothetical protein